MSRALICLFACALIGCTTPAAREQEKIGSWFMKDGAYPADATSRQLLIGTWLGDSTEADGTRRYELAIRRADGSYQVSFRATRSGRTVQEQTEVGLWGVSGDIYFTITQGYLLNGSVQRTPPQDASFYDAYRITRLTADEFEYVHVLQGEKSRDRKVAEGTRLPDDAT